jgi:FkbM family methyltransferase
VVPLAFTDNQPLLQGKEVDGLAVLTPEEAARRFPDAVYVVTIWSDRIGHPLAAAREQMSALGVARVVTFTALYESHPEQFFPDVFLDRRDALLGQEVSIHRAANLWADQGSSAEFMAQLAMRYDLDFGHVTGGVPYPAYFPPDLFTLRTDESFVDCGAFNGDTYKVFRSVSGGCFARYIGLEPDPANFAKLSTEVGDDPRAKLFALGAAEREETVRFLAAGTAESRAGNGGMQSIRCCSLDAILSDEQPTYLKMDIEGAEAAALRGARGVLARHRPIFAVSVYHKATDLWDLPLLMASLVTDYRFYLRAEKKAGWDLVCYGIPSERQAKPARLNAL